MPTCAAVRHRRQGRQENESDYDFWLLMRKLHRSSLTCCKSQTETKLFLDMKVVINFPS